MKKAYELATLTGTQVMILVASETGHVYTFATQKLQPMITSDAGKALIQTCLNSPDPPPVGKDSRMTETGYEEVDLSYHVHEEDTNQSTSNPDDPHDSIAASQASSREPSPETDSVSNAPPEPPLMTIPPHVMTELLKTAQTNNEDNKSTTQPIPFSSNSFQAAQKRSQSIKAQQTLGTNVTDNQNDLSAGPLSFHGHFQRTEKTKQSNEQPKITVFRPIEPKNQMKTMEAPNKNNKPPLRIYKNIAPNPVRAPSQQIILSNHHPNLPIQVMPPGSQLLNHTTTSQESGPQNLSLHKRK